MNKNFNEMLNNSKDMPKIQIIKGKKNLKYYVQDYEKYLINI